MELLCPVLLFLFLLSFFASFLLRQLLQCSKMAELPRVALLWLPARQEAPGTLPGRSNGLSLPLISWVSSSDVLFQTCLYRSQATRSWKNNTSQGSGGLFSMSPTLPASKVMTRCPRLELVTFWKDRVPMPSLCCGLGR